MKNYNVKMTCTNGNVIECELNAPLAVSAEARAKDIFKYQIYKNQGLTDCKVTLA